MWTKEEIQILKELFPILPREEVAKRLARKVYSVANKASSLGIKRQKPTDKLTKEYLEEKYIHTNKTKEEIAIEVGCSPQSVANYLKKYGLSNKKFKGRDEKGRFVKGHKNWNEGLTKNDDPRLAHVSRRLKEVSPTSRLEVRKKLSKIQKEHFSKPENRERLRMIAKAAWRNSQFRNKISRLRKQMWENPEYRIKTVRKILKGWHKKPTEPEKRLITIIEKHGLPFVYNGNNGNVIIHGKVPDFISTNGSKIVVEVFGRVFHDPEESIVKVRYHQTEEGRKKFWEKQGWHCIVLWDHELIAETGEDIVLQKLKGVG
jgi:very-short-patch-repair endonuclease